MKQIFNDYLRHNIPFWVLMLTSIFLMVASLFIPPVGVISSSVIAGIGELLGFGALWAVMVAIEKGIDTKVKHNNTEVTIGDISGKDEDKEIK